MSPSGRGAGVRLGLTGLNLVGAGIVDVGPGYDHAGLTGIAVAAAS